MSERAFLTTLLALFTVLLFLEVPGSRLFDPDEARYAEIPREMLVSGDFVTPTLNGSHYFEKPPLLYWMNAVALKTLGENPFAARLASRLAAIGTVLLLILALNTPAAPAAGLWAALFFISAPLSFVLGRLNLTDGLLTFGMTLTFLSIRAFIKAEDEGRSTRRAQIELGLGTAIAFMSKGLIAVVLPGMVLFLWTALFKRWTSLRQIVFSLAPVIFVALSAPWFILVEKANPGFSKFFFVHEHFARFATRAADRPGPPTYFLVTFLVGFLPWTPFFLKSLKGIRRDPERMFFALWFFVPLVFFSVSRSKLTPYILPAFPAAAALTAFWAVRATPEQIRRPLFYQALFWTVAAPMGILVGLKGGFLHQYKLISHVIVVAAALIFGTWAAVGFARRYRISGLGAAAGAWAWVYFGLVLATPRLAARYAAFDLAKTAEAAHPRWIVAYHCYPQSVPWALKHPVPVVGFRGELASDGKLSPDFFWESSDFWGRWNSPEPMVVCVPAGAEKDFEGANKRAMVIATSHRYLLLANFLPQSDL